MATSPKKRQSRNIISERVRQARHRFNPPLTQDELSGKLASQGVQLDRVAVAKIEIGLRCAFDYEVRALAAALRACVAIPSEKRSEVTFHCLRHTAASLMVQNGVSLFDVGKILGQSTMAVTMRYAHFAPEAGRVAVDRLGKPVALGGNGGDLQRMVKG